MDELCQKFLLDPTRNPKTGRKIKVGGPIHKQYMELTKNLAPTPLPKPVVTSFMKTKIPKLIIPQIQSEMVVQQHTIKFSPYENMSLDSLLITDNSQRLKYYERPDVEKSNIYMQQRKLVVIETLFFTLFHEAAKVPNPIVVYVGAAPGTHIKVLQSLFANFTFHLYDSYPFEADLADGVSIFTHQQFTDKDAAEWSNRQDIYFISGIRSKIITDDLQLQKKWFQIIKPVRGLLKFRLPYPNNWNSDTYQYFSGYLLKQPWAPANSAECKLVPTADETVEWNLINYEEQMFYHNVITRERQKFGYNLLAAIDPYGDTFDSMAELMIWHNYLLRYNPGGDLPQQISKLNEMITNTLKRKAVM